jgi:hypothetical protein
LRLYLNAFVPAPPEAFWSSLEHGRLHAGDDQQRMIEWQRMRAQGVRQGLPDAILVWCFKHVAFELKATTTMRPAQKLFRDAWRRNGGIHIEARSIVEVDTALRAAGLPVPRSMAIVAANHDAALSVPAPAKKRSARLWSEEDLAEAGKRRLDEFIGELP